MRFLRDLREANEIWASAGLRRIGVVEWTWLSIMGWLRERWHRMRCRVIGHDYEYTGREPMYAADLAWFRCRRCARTDGRPIP